MSKEKNPILLIHGYKTVNVMLHIPGSPHTEFVDKPIKWNPYFNTDFENLPKWLIDDGFEVYLARYDSNHKKAPSIEELAKQIRLVIKKLAKRSPTKKITIFAHSIGGLTTRAYIDSPEYKLDKKAHGGDLVEDVYMTGTPNLGMSHYRLCNLILDFNHNLRTTTPKYFTSKHYMKKFNKKYKHKNKVKY